MNTRILSCSLEWIWDFCVVQHALIHWKLDCYVFLVSKYYGSSLFSWISSIKFLKSIFSILAISKSLPWDWRYMTLNVSFLSHWVFLDSVIVSHYVYYVLFVYRLELFQIIVGISFNKRYTHLKFWFTGATRSIYKDGCSEAIVLFLWYGQKCSLHIKHAFLLPWLSRLTAPDLRCLLSPNYHKCVP